MAEKIELSPVSSTNLGALGYNPKKQILAVQFAKTGVIFHYAGVEAVLAAGFMTAESIGRYYAQHIRGKFPAERMTGPCANCGVEGWVGDPCEECGTAAHVAVPYTPKRTEREEATDETPIDEVDD